MKILAIVPARGGSKRLPGKNMRSVGGIPLVGHAIRAAHGMDVVVSSDDLDTMLYALSIEGCMYLKRPPRLSTDEAKSADVVLHVLEELEGYDAFILLQPTSPLRTSKDVQRAIELFRKANADSLVSFSVGSKNPNGAIYIARVDWFKEHKKFADQNTVVMQMPRELSVDIDTIEDLEQCEAYLSCEKVAA